MMELVRPGKINMKRFFFLILFLFLIACSHSPAISSAESISLTISPGEVRWIKFPAKGREIRLRCKDSDIKFEIRGEEGHSIVVADYFSETKPFKCQVYSEGVVTHEMNFQVIKRKYKSEKLKVPPKTIKLSPVDQERAAREQEMLNKIYASSLNTIQFDKHFISPMNSVVTSYYGTRRVYNKVKQGQHLGIDYRAAIGDKVPTANRGKVVFSGDLFYTGGTVIVDHGLDIFTVYGHLSKTMVKEGEIVERGQLIALSGNSGRTSGPHLHWGVKVQGDYIDGFVLIDETKKYLSE